MNKGFSLLEILIVISIVIIIGAIGSGFYLGYVREVEIKSGTQTIMYNLKQAQSKSMAGEGGFKWGVHFVNSTNDYYEIFSTPTDYNDVSKNKISTIYLPKNISFSTPAEGSSKDIIFSKISGWATDDTIGVASYNISKVIKISSIGSMYIQ